MTHSDGPPTTLPDTPARERIASDLESNLLVEAGAGSGKTTELVSRMVALIASGTAEIHEIAAVTFTRKAAAELRERFQARLEERVREEAGTGEERDRLRSALQDIDRAFVGTIHSFCGRLLRERPLEVGLDPAFEELSVEERLTVRRQFWEGYLERLARESDPALEELARAGIRVSTLFSLFGQLVENPDVDFTADMVDAPSRDEMVRVHARLKTLVERGWELMPERVPDKDWDPLQKVIRRLRFTRDVTGWREPGDFFHALAQICKDGPSGHKPVQKRWKDRALAKAFGEEVNRFAVGDTEATRLLRRWYEYRYALAVRLASRAAEAFWAYRRRAGRLDFQDLLVLTAELLRGNPDVRRELGTRYRRVLVDEFQDTDPLQAEIMMLMGSEPLPEDEGGSADWRSAVPRPGALFVVGDPKQSIYRFRRADIQLYQLVKDRFREVGAVLELTSNFRSRPPIGRLVNELFSTDGFFPAEATPEQAAFEPLQTRPAPENRATENRAAEGVFQYDVSADAGNRRAIAMDDAERLATWIRGRVDAGERTPGDFLLLTRTKASIAHYARALEDHGLPVQVTGAGVGVEEELRELRILLECMIDPTDPVKVVAALVGLFFGLDYERLLAHRAGGGFFDAMRSNGAGDPEVSAALEILHRWWRTSTREPADVFVMRLVSEVGLLPYAAAGALGSLRAGAVVYALDTVRAAALAGDASLPGALDVLDAALALAEAEAPLEPGRSDAVRVMNLHQAKGLEAQVVVLAEPTGDMNQAADIHVRRDEEGRARGYLKVSEARSGFRSATTLAHAVGWSEWEEAERRFGTAEEVRLLYVAVTRAREELVVARRPDKPEASPWSALGPWLDRHAEPLTLEPAEPGPAERLDPDWPETAAVEIRRVEDRIRGMAEPSFVFSGVTSVAKEESGEPVRHAAERSRERGAPAEEPGDFRGYAWGSVVHAALAAAPTVTGAGGLREVCRELLVEHGRPLDDHGEPVELGELLELVGKILASELWLRARAAARVLTEVPFALREEGRGAGSHETPAPPPSEATRTAFAPEGRRQLDLFGSMDEPPERDRSSGAGQEEPEPDGGGAPRVLEGVVDLVFEEEDGWVVVDYKTDVGSDPHFPRRLAGYRRQVDLYADAWAALTGARIKERVLFFTAQERMERW